MKIDKKIIKELSDYLEEFNLTELEYTEKDRKKLKEQLEDIHVLFKNFIKDNRKILDIEKVATGEYWYGKDALDLKLIDKILTSDEHVISMKESFDIIHIK